MLAVFRIWWLLLLSVLAVQLGNGVQATIIGLKVAASGFSPGQVGWIISAFYAGQISGALAAPRLIGRFGHVPIYVASGAAYMLCPLGFTAEPDLVVWAATRFALGFALATIFVVLEAWLSDRSSNKERGRVFAAYIMVQLIGLLGSQSFVPLLADHFSWALMTIAAFGILAVAPIAFGNLTKPERHPFQRADFRALFHASPVGVVTSIVAGFSWAVSVAMAPIYATRAGLDATGTATLIAATVIGGIILQFPIAWASDMRDRRYVLAGMALSAALCAAIGAMADPGSTAMLVAFALFGGFTFPFYTVASAHVNDRIEGPQRVAAAAAMGLIFAIGSIVGPFGASEAMAALGPPGYFIALAAVTGSLAVFTVYRIVVGRPSAVEETA